MEEKTLRRAELSLLVGILLAVITMWFVPDELAGEIADVLIPVTFVWILIKGARELTK